MKTLLFSVLLSNLVLVIFSFKQLTSEGFFICSAILMGSCLIGLASMTKRECRLLHSDFEDFCKALDEQPLREEELRRKIGKTTFQANFNDPPEQALSDHQITSLRLFLYEGKLVRRRGYLALPNQTIPGDAME